MKYKCCRFMQSGLNFHRNEIKFCNRLKNTGPVFPQDFNDLPAFIEKIRSMRDDIIKSCKSGIFDEACKHCECLEEKEWITSDKIEILEFNHWTNCNCYCIYCSSMIKNPKNHCVEIRKSDYVELFPVASYLIEKNLISQNAEIYFSGGEPTVLEEFPNIVNLLLSNNIRKITVLTSGIRYSEDIEKILSSETGWGCISIDSGSSETYKKIKRRDKFNTVVDNIKKYLKSSEQASNNLELKYIILDDINDTTEEIDRWLYLCKDLGIKKTVLSIEYHNAPVEKAGEPLPKKYYELYDYAKNKAGELGLSLKAFEFFVTMMETGHY